MTETTENSRAAPADLDTRTRVFVTFDVELWPRSWTTHRSDFADAFDRYILGRTSRGTVGLPFQLRMARDHGLRFVFFVESLFACEFGLSPLVDIVEMIREAGQEVQVHAHPEWVRHSSKPLFDTGGRYFFREFSEDEQARLVSTACANLSEAGAPRTRAFRAGSFASNADTLRAVARSGLDIDSSFKLGSGLEGGPREAVEGFFAVDGVAEYPLAVYRDWPRHHRHLQIGSCSSQELAHVVRGASDSGWPAVVILSHSVELLNDARTMPDRVVLGRFERFCRFLAEHANVAPTAFFRDERLDELSLGQVTPVSSSSWRTMWRAGEQLRRRVLQ